MKTGIAALATYLFGHIMEQALNSGPTTKSLENDLEATNNHSRRGENRRTVPRSDKHYQWYSICIDQIAQI